MSNSIDSDDMEEMGIPDSYKYKPVRPDTGRYRVQIKKIHKKVVLSPTEEEVKAEMDTFIVDKKKFEDKDLE